MQVAIHEVKRQIETENAELSMAILEADNLLQKMNQIVNTEELDGEAYGNIKEYYMTVQIPLAKALICMYQEKVSANNNYVSNLSAYFGDMKEINQDAISEQLNKIRWCRQNLEEMFLIKDICQDYIDVLYALEQDLIAKIEKVNEFNYVTAGLYNDFEVRSNLVIQGIAYTDSVHYEGGGIYSNLPQFSSAWKNQIQENIENSLESIKEIKNDSLIEQIKEYAKQWDIDKKDTYWSWGDIYNWKFEEGNEFLSQEKEKFVYTYRDVIKDAANKYDVPEFLLAGVAFMEYGGDPYVFDDGGYVLRRYFNDIVGIEYNSISLTRNAYLTSFGNVSIQVRRIAECLGMDVNDMTESQKSEIIQMAREPVTNIYIVAKHLSDLKNIDYPNIPAESMTEEQITVTSTRYNRGPDLTIEEIKENTKYGTDMYGHQIAIERGLYENK